MVKNTSSNKISRAALWLCLAFLVFPMFASYFFDDMFSSISYLFSDASRLELAWDSATYGVYLGGYSMLCVFGGMVLGGILLDRFGLRLVGTIFMFTMFLGAIIILFAMTYGFESKLSLGIAYVGRMLFGLGSEIGGVAVSRSIAKWFKHRNLALAMGLQLAIARLGTAFAFIIAPLLVSEKLAPQVYTLSDTARPVIFAVILIVVGLFSWLLFVLFDYRKSKLYFDDEDKSAEHRLNERFHLSDILNLLKNPQFIMIALLCVFFYCCIISFKKFAAAIVIPRFDMNVESAKWLISLIPFFTVVFTPLFGFLVDRVGKATIWMIVGAFAVLISHIILAFAPAGISFYGYFAISLLGLGYSLVPSAMWPSVSRIVKDSNLATAFSLLYWIQNLGLLLVPIVVGAILSSGENNITVVYAEYFFIVLSVIAVLVSFCLRVYAKMKGNTILDLSMRK